MTNPHNAYEAGVRVQESAREWSQLNSVGWPAAQPLAVVTIGRRLLTTNVGAANPARRGVVDGLVSVPPSVGRGGTSRRSDRMERPGDDYLK
jgi:hypothetical protein